MENTIYGLFQETVNRYRNNLAIIENKRTMTFGELSDMVDMIADSFPDHAKSVGIVMRHRVEMIASILAVLKTGVMYVPAEPTYPTGRIHYMINCHRFLGASMSLYRLFIKQIGFPDVRPGLLQ